MPTLEPTLDTIREAQARIREHVVRTPLLSPAELSESPGRRPAAQMREHAILRSIQVPRCLQCRVFADGRTGPTWRLCPLVGEPRGGVGASGAAAWHSRSHRDAAQFTGKQTTGRPRIGRRTHPLRSFNGRAAGGDGAVLAQTGANLIHPYDDYRVMAGQATAAVELLEQAEAPEFPAGALGRRWACCPAPCWPSNRLAPSVQVIGVEPAWADDGYRSWKAGAIESPTRYDTVADGLANFLGAADVSDHSAFGR